MSSELHMGIVYDFTWVLGVLLYPHCIEDDTDGSPYMVRPACNIIAEIDEGMNKMYEIGHGYE